MVQNLYRVKANIKSKSFQVVPEIVANDSVVFEVELFDGTDKMPLSSNYVYTLTSLKRNKQSVIREGSVQGDVVRFELGSSEMTEPGIVEATVQVFDSSNRRISSVNFNYKVKRDPSLQGSLPADDKTLVMANESLFLETIQKAEEQKQRVDDLIAGSPQPSEVVDARGGHTVLRDRLESIDSLLAKNETKLKVIGIPMPPKTGVTKNSPKIIRRVSDSRFQIFQALDNGGYLRYTLESGIGGTSSIDAGKPHDLLRVIQVRAFVDGYVWYYEDPVEGALSVITPATKSANNIEQRLLSIPAARNQERNTSSLTNDVGVSGNIIPANATRTWNIPQTLNRDIEVFFSTSANSSEDVEILVDGVSRAKIDLRSQNAGVYSAKLQIPSSHHENRTSEIQVKNNTGGNCYIIGFNIKRLKDWKGEHINNFKFIGSDKVFIDTLGASDYAIRFTDVDRWHGSFHGGETLLSCDIVTCLSSARNYEPHESEIKRYQLSEMPNTWGITSTIKITQKTNISNHCEALSVFKFDKDGSMEMDFSIYNIIPRLYSLYTALTSTHKDFLHVAYPVMEQVPVNADTLYDVNEGYFVQYNESEKIGLGIRFSKFADLFNDVGARIKQNDSYSKFYYGIVNDWSDGAEISSVNFSKGLDFFVDSW